MLIHIQNWNSRPSRYIREPNLGFSRCHLPLTCSLLRLSSANFLLWLSIALFSTHVQIGIVLVMLSGYRFPFRVESTIMHPPFCPSIQIHKYHHQWKESKNQKKKSFWVVGSFPIWKEKWETRGFASVNVQGGKKKKGHPNPQIPSSTESSKERTERSHFGWWGISNLNRYMR